MPTEPIRISAKRKWKKEDVQHITIEEVKEDKSPSPTPQVSMFDHIEAHAPQTSVFYRLSTIDKRDEGRISQPSVFNRLGTTKEGD